jgi:hypothetical protein
MEEMNSKYPRTYHLPWSPGSTSDDKKLSDNWFIINGFKDSEIIITEKLDGENSSFSNCDVFSRSHSVPTRSPWSRNLWENDGLLWKIKDKIGENEWIYGENLFGEHSIHYNRLTSYFHMFAARHMEEDLDYWYSWDDVELTASILGVPTVPALWRGVINSETQLRELVNKFMSEPSTYGDTKEGVVIRKVGQFNNKEFSKNVCKYVRANHVQTDKHWTKNWNKASLIDV